MQDILDGRVLKREIRVHPFQFRVFRFQLAQPLHVGDGSADVLTASFKERVSRDPMLPQQVGDGSPALSFLQDLDDLGLGESRLPHEPRLIAQILAC